MLSGTHTLMACASCFCVGLSIGLLVAWRIQLRATAAFNRICRPADACVSGE